MSYAIFETSNFLLYVHVAFLPWSFFYFCLVVFHVSTVQNRMVLVNLVIQNTRLYVRYTVKQDP